MQAHVEVACLLRSKKNSHRGGALASSLQSFETDLPGSDENLIGLMAVNRELVAPTEAPNGSNHVVPDMDSTEMLGRIWVLRVPGG